MMKQLLSLLVCATSLLLFSCEKEGTCERRIKNYQGAILYQCNENTAEGSCDKTETDYYEEFYEDKSCKELGYSYNGGMNWSYSSTSNTTPGKYGKWGNSTSGSGGGGSGTCSGSYVSPSSDAQLNAYCGAAYTYRCTQGMSVTSPQVKAVCQYYQDIKVAGVPNCSYCY
ncbi:hypothetical protein F0P96_14360 [Hymenobacter busanensis]|uniref:Uncharacterized protein n=1 Tax=Hymenobacter busanensis TaxID=2607656 RepID=A0A7L4ZZY2_9BACT|nr:hypothetical protein [Hymenobacter busanensis]KAA9331423.1 hypothetical protein F0P96_14360 [Hymenobacter busanensis]QHJ08577.1 hypothetical protein GUY19_15290 [Hymenobacter busanensis]